MSSAKRYIVLTLMLATTFSARAQCPALLSTLLAGGTFNDGGAGPCVYAAGGAISTSGNINFTGSLTLTGVTSFTIANDFVWNGGAFNIQGVGTLNVGNGTTGSLTINSGSVVTNDGGSGTVSAAANSTINISSSASLLGVTMDFQPSSLVANNGTISASAFISLSGNLTNSGTITLTHTSNDITIDGTLSSSGQINAAHDVVVASGGNLTVGVGGSVNADNFHIEDGGVTLVQSGGAITANDNNAGSSADEDDNVIEGSLTSSGTLSFNGDIVVQGATASMTINGGTVAVTRPTDGDLEVTGGASFVMNTGTLNIPDDITTRIDGDTNFPSSGNFEINGSSIVTVTDDIILTGGSFENDGTVSADDITMSGGTFHNTDALTINDGDLALSGGIFENDGTISITDDLLITGGTFYNDETITVDDMAVSGTGTLQSHEAGAVITLADQYSDVNCPYANGIYHYCSCIGNPPDNDNVSAICASALPIELLAFSGSQKDNEIQLNWTTATETNNEFFTIQKLTANDLFEEVTRVPGAGTTVLKQTYEAIDPAPVIGKNYYRLKQTDYDGRTSVSELIKIDFEPTSFVFHLYPNPTNDQTVNVVVQGSVPNQSITFELNDLLGQTIKSEVAKTNETGSVRATLTLTNISAGIYWVAVAGKVQRLIVR